MPKNKITNLPSNIDSLVVSLNDFILEVDETGRFLNVWTDDESGLFVPKSQIIGSTILEIIPPPLSHNMMETVLKTVAIKSPMKLEYQSPVNTDEYYVAHFQYLQNSNNHIIISIRNISATEKAERQLQESEQRFRILIQTSSDVITILDKDGKVVYDSFSLLTHFGYEKPLTGATIFDLIHPDDVGFAIAKFQEFKKMPGVTEPFEFRFKAGDGSWRYVESIGNNLFDNPSIQGYVINSRDITQRKQMQHVIDNSNYTLKGILESTADSIFALDHQYRYTSFNSAHKKIIQKLFGITIQIGDLVLLEKTASLLNIQTEMHVYLDRCFAGEIFNITRELKNKNNRILYTEINFNPIKNESNKIVGIAVFSKDITQKVIAEQELIEARNTAIASAQTKSEFLSNMSHEIRTPINAIMGLTELLLKKTHDKDILEYLESIKYSTDNLLVVINDVLDFSKIDAGKVTIEKIDFNVQETIESVASLFHFKAKSKGIHFNIHIDPNIPIYVVGDPYRLNQILNNLISNAIKFTNTGSVNLNALVESKTNNELRLKFVVSDTGVGIASDKKDLIFESFIQGYTDVTRKYGGTGLGLAITQRLTHLQGGTISVQSELGSGSVFTIEIPYGISTTISKPIAIQPKNNVKSLLGKHILIAEDNTMNQFVIQQILTSWQATYDIIENGKEAINCLKQKQYDLVLMDLQMPEMSGYDATAFIRSKNSEVLNPFIPIIALTADAFMETKRKVLEIGMNDFITKPFNQEDLYAKIQKHIL